MPWWNSNSAGWHWDTQKGVWALGAPVAGSPLAKRTWQCAHCHSTNHAPKACTVCGLRRSYAEAAKGSLAPGSVANPQPTTPLTAQPKSTTRTQLDQIASELASNLKDLQARAAASSVPATTLPAAGGDAGKASSTPSRAELVKKLKRYEASVELYKDAPDEAELAELHRKIVATKADLSQRKPKPVGAQLDNAREALQRATARREEATKSLHAAQLILDTAALEEQQVKKDVAQLEAQVVATPEQSTMDSLLVQLGLMMDLIKTDTDVSADQVAHAEKHVAELVAGFTSVLARSTATKDHARKVQAAAEGKPLHRLPTKGPLPTIPPLSPMPTHHVRETKKQPRSNVEDSVFKVVRRRLTKPRSKSADARAGDDPEL